MGNEREKKIETNLGGTDDINYQASGDVAYFDKPDHFSRSVSHQSNHMRVVNRLFGNGLEKFQRTTPEIDIHSQDQTLGVPSDQHRWNKRKMRRIKWH